MDSLLLSAVKGSVFRCINICSVDTRAIRPGERFAVLSCICSVFVVQLHQVVPRPNAVIADGVKDLGYSVIYLCHIQIGRTLVGCFEGFERCLEFRDDVGRRRHHWIVLLSATGSRWESFGMLISTIEEH